VANRAEQIDKITAIWDEHLEVAKALPRLASGRFQRERRPLAALALHTNTSALAAIGNDYAYEYVFARELSAMRDWAMYCWQFPPAATPGISCGPLRRPPEQGCGHRADWRAG
jgi:hypothetical protein